MRTAAYARYSSDSQRDASLDDQLRNCRAYCARQGWPDPVVYTDAAISGSRADRPGYLRLLSDADGFDVIVVDDLSRLSRDSIETAQALRRLKFRGVRVIGVSDDVDTSNKGHKINAGLRGLMGELYLDDLADKTHRGLAGRALAGSSAGGLPYGYTAPSVGQRAIHPEQAEVVRRIFAQYLAGDTPRAIAGSLNGDGIRPARGTTWAMSAIHGDLRRGIGILANPIYVGRQIWNRSRWVKHPETGRRVRQERPQTDWITTEHPELAIVDAATWARVQARLRGNHRDTGTGAVGRPTKHLLSGLLRCGECGGPMVAIDGHSYGCSRAKDRGTCASKIRVRRRDTETALLAGVREELLSEFAFQRYQRAVTAALKQAAPDLDVAKRALADAERVRENVMQAIRAGIITPTTKAEMLSSEAKVTAAQAALNELRAYQPAQVMPRAKERWHGIVAALSEKGRNVPAARDALRELLGEFTIVRNENGDLFAEIAASSDTQKIMVAGAGSVLYMTAPVRIPLGRAS